MAFDPLSAALELGTSVISKIWPDPVQQAKEQRKLAELYQNGDLAQLNAHVQLMVGQLKVNEAEANHRSVFVAGWRPAVGWLCVTAIGMNFVLFPIVEVVNAYLANPVTLPAVGSGDLFELLMGMLGLGAFRTYEKTKGVTK